MKKRVLLLGATGSIGTSSLEVIDTFPDEFELVGLSAHTRLEELIRIGQSYPGSKTALSGAQETPKAQVDYWGPDAPLRLIEETNPDIVINGIMGSAGLLSSALCVENGIDLALANKETIVMAGELLLPLAVRTGSAVLPVDSEHAAVFQLSRYRDPAEIDQIILTASGGAFRNRPIEDLPSVSVEEALQHPTWSMGPKITIDSATMANKGLEVIEAARFFQAPAEAIRVLIHPTSTVHSLIRTCDGALYAQLSAPDMKNPIINALSYPKIMRSDFAPLDLAGKKLEFFNPEGKRYPLLFLAFEACRRGAAYPTAFNAANEVAVAAFIEGRLDYPGISRLVDTVLQQDWSEQSANIDHVLEIDARIRQVSRSILQELRCY